MTSKIGHTGTLDPMAEGLMILTVGKATKILPYIAIHDKEYVAEMRFGIKTDTGDITGNVIAESDKVIFSEDEIRKVLESFKGRQQQIPPMYSAKKVNGQKLYQLARNNVEIEREAVEITIHDIELISLKDDILKFRVSCSSGTYVRTLCEDIAERCGSVGTMISLYRTRIDRYSCEEACDIDTLTAENARFLSTYDILYHYPYYEVDDVTDILNGKDVEIDSQYQLLFLTHKGKIIAAYEKTDGNIYRCKRGLW